MLVTGASGHVGGAIARTLTDEGHDVVGLGRRLTKGNRLLAGALIADLGQPGAVDAVAAGQPPCDAIVHAAAALDKDDGSSAIALTNGLGTQQLLKLATAWDVSAFVYLSGVTVIGTPQQLPITEEHPTAPLTAYHASKLFGEHLVAIAARAGLPAVSLRLSAPVGPGMPAGRILSVFVERALEGRPLELAGAGSRRQDYVDVRDVAAAVARSLREVPAGVLNIAAGASTSNRELAQLCVETLASSSEIVHNGFADPEDDIRWEIAIGRAQEAIGYRPAHSLADSIAAVADESRARHHD